MQICYIMIELTFLKELILIELVHQMILIFVTIGILLDRGLSFNRISALMYDVLMLS